MGYEAMREATLARQKEHGPGPGRHRAAAVEPDRHARTRTGPDGLPFPELDYTRPWDSLNDEEKRLFARMAEVYAGFLAHADHHIGRLLDYLEETEQLENTLVVVVSDNGASGEGGPNGSVNEMKFANGVADDLQENLAKLDELGGTRTYNHYPNGWAMAFNTPFKMWKRYEFNGGTADPCIISWPAGTAAARRDPRAVLPRGRPGPDDPGRARRRGARDHQGPHPERTSTASACAAASRTRRRRPGGARSSTRCSARARSGTRAGRRSPPTRRSPAGATSTTTSGSSTTSTSTGPSCTTWPPRSRSRLRELVNIWFSEAGANGAFPLDDRSAGGDPVDATAAAHRGQGPLRLLPGHRSRARSGRPSTPAAARS